MKKLLLALMILGVSLAANAKDYSSYCSNKTASKSLTGTISSISGMSFLERNIIEYQIEKALKRETGAKFKTNLGTYFGKSPLTGVFNNLDLSADSVLYEGFYFSNVKAKSICPYNEVSYKNNKLSFVQNSVFEYSAQITQDDLSKSMNSSFLGKFIDKLNSDSTISSLVTVKSSNAYLKNDKIIFNYEVVPLSVIKDIFSFLPIKVSPIRLSFSSGLAVQDGKLQLLNFALNNKKSSYSFLLPVLNKFNPTSFNFTSKKTKFANGKLEVDDVKIKDSTITLKGAVIVFKD